MFFAYYFIIAIIWETQSGKQTFNLKQKVEFYLCFLLHKM